MKRSFIHIRQLRFLFWPTFIARHVIAPPAFVFAARPLAEIISSISGFQILSIVRVAWLPRFGSRAADRRQRIVHIFCSQPCRDSQLHVATPYCRQRQAPAAILALPARRAYARSLQASPIYASRHAACRSRYTAAADFAARRDASQQQPPPPIRLFS